MAYYGGTSSERDFRLKSGKSGFLTQLKKTRVKEQLSHIR
jgi:hypothetical protein